MQNVRLQYDCCFESIVSSSRVSRSADMQISRGQSSLIIHFQLTVWMIVVPKRIDVKANSHLEVTEISRQSAIKSSYFCAALIFARIIRRYKHHIAVK